MIQILWIQHYINIQLHSYKYYNGYNYFKKNSKSNKFQTSNFFFLNDSNPMDTTLYFMLIHSENESLQNII
jgi:hypothetical protein